MDCIYLRIRRLIKMAYTPELSMKSSSTLRRISWALGVPMTKGIEHVFDYLPQILWEVPGGP